MNDLSKKTKRIKKKSITISVILIAGIVLFYFYNSVNQNNKIIQQENITMDYTIYPSTIPKSQLLRIEEAEKLYHQAFDNQVFYTVVNPEALVKFIKHAWQWDKNAMPYYYDLLL